MQVDDRKTDLSSNLGSLSEIRDILFYENDVCRVICASKLLTCTVQIMAILHQNSIPVCDFNMFPDYIA